MAAPTTSMATSYKVGLQTATHNHTITTGHVFKCALYKAAASVAGTHNATETNYSGMGADELATAGGYTAAGFAWTAAQNITPASTGTTVFTSWSVNPNWTSATFTTSGCLIYNSSASNAAVCNLAFSGDQTIAGGTFTITLPVNDATTAVLRIL